MCNVSSHAIIRRLENFSGAFMAFIKATIDLGAIKRNYRTIADFVGKDTVTSAVVKDDAYRMGAPKVSHALYDAGCRNFWVAYLAEALTIRKVLPSDARIYYLQGFQESDIPIAKEQNIIPVINSLNEFCAIRNNNLEFVLFVDTGFSRLGLRAEDIDAILPQLEHENIAYVISHLACSDDIKHPMNLAQKTAFDSILAKIRTKMNVKASLSATGGALMGKDYAYDLVRIGSFLHDIQLNSPIEAESVLTLETQVLQRYILPAGNTVGYSATYTAPHDIKLAVISIGHGDGLRRHLGNKGFIHFYGRDKVYKAPIVGNISMDLTTCDVTEVPDEFTEPGSVATVLSKAYRVKDMAADAGLLSYEILIGLQLKPDRCTIVYKK